MKTNKLNYAKEETKKEKELREKLIKSMLKEGKKILKRYGIKI